MTNGKLEKTRKLLISHLQNKEAQFKTVHPWRKDWKYTVLHSYRVEKYVEIIFGKESSDIPEDEIEVTRIAAILHDIGKQDSRSNHAEQGAKIIESLIDEGSMDYLSLKQQNKLIYMVLKHSEKENRLEADLCLNVLKDADLLDETGMMSILMCSNWVDRGSPFFFNEMQKRIEEKEIAFCDQGFELLYTKSAKQILSEKKRFIELACKQLKSELMEISAL